VDQRKHIPGGEPDPQGKGQYFVVVFPMKCVRLNASLAANAAVGVADLCTGDSMSQPICSSRMDAPAAVVTTMGCDWHFLDSTVCLLENGRTDQDGVKAHNSRRGHRLIGLLILVASGNVSALPELCNSSQLWSVFPDIAVSNLEVNNASLDQSSPSDPVQTGLMQFRQLTDDGQ